MKILILNWRDIKNPLSGGAEISLFEHAKFWKKKGAEVTWFSAAYKNSKPHEMLDGIKTIRKGSQYTVHFWAFICFMKGDLGKPDLVIDSFHGLPFFSIFYFPRHKVIALINEIAGKIWYFNTNFFIASIGYGLERLSFFFYKTVPFITGSTSTKKELTDVGIPSHNITVVHHGTHFLNGFGGATRENPPVVIYLGRISLDKGIGDALQAFREVKKNFSNAKFWIVGGEEKKGSLQEYVDTFAPNEKNSIIYYGFVNDEKKFDLLKKSWVLLHPSYKEGWGLTVIEAAAKGIPTIGYKVPGLIDSVQNGKTGVLVEPKNISQLAAAVIDLINDKQKYEKLSKNAIQWSKQFTWDVSTQKSWEIVEHAFKKNN